mgnify:CR=1 FL=1
MYNRNHNALRFNRDIVECKDGSVYTRKPRKLGFNRDIVECKGAKQVDLFVEDLRFNRDIVECKVNTRDLMLSIIFVLIET